ncbi:MAG: hypothetical protein JOZ87_09390 [Chloroflexi bacterium]|nr:hypothetical protein [Chloroflexota bacterium]
MHRDVVDFTPFGYLRNPAHRARDWADTVGGNLRTCPDRLGVEWAYPVGRDANARAGLAIETTVDARPCRSRADFDAIGLACRHHSCLIVAYAWRLNGMSVDACFFLAADDALALRITVLNTALESRAVDLRVMALHDGTPPGGHALAGATSLAVSMAPGEQRQVVAVLGRGKDRASADAEARRASADADTTYARLLDEDAAFDAACPRLSGDWPRHWSEGLHHDFQTTRLLVQPPGGIFTDVWPAWMAAWPRVVLAEGTLDMLRLAYAQPGVALRAVATLLRDAPDPNVPCVFRDGEYNMVAADGSLCGTSPAWCLPFQNLRLLYLRTLDREWLARIYPFAAAYLEWWLTERTDSEGWLVYRCTWESGEDGNPRLDPTGSGNADISARVRPVELQATLGHAAGVLAFFAAELGLDAARWRRLEADYRERTRSMFDADTGRYRDWLIAEQRQQPDCPERPYWGVDACRYSAQSLTPLLLGLPLDAREVWRHASPPWTLWPSWTWSLVESAAAAGMFAGVGQVAFDIVDRVYRITTRRELGSLPQPRPMPGSSPEFWPEDWRTYAGSDAYGWGATTANLLIRHLFGFKESSDTTGFVFDLTPALPAPMLHVGARYAIDRLNYRGRHFNLAYTVRADRLLAEVELEGTRHAFETHSGERVTIRID